MSQSLQYVRLLSYPKATPFAPHKFRSCPGKFAWLRAGISSIRRKAPPASAMAGKRKAKASEDAEEPQKTAKTEGSLVHSERVRSLKDGDVKAGPVIYWMSRDQRVQDNWAFLHAAEVASKTKSPIAVAFNLVPEYLVAGARQFGFMLRGLKLMQPKLEALNIPFFMVKGDPIQTIPELCTKTGAACLVTDFASLRLGRQWRDEVAKKIDIPFYEVDAHNVIPCWIASPKREYGARTIRSKIHKKLPEFLHDFPKLEKQPKWDSKVKPDKVDWDAEIKAAVDKGKDVPEVTWVKPGEDEAMKAAAEEGKDVPEVTRVKPGEDETLEMLNGKEGFLSTDRLKKFSTHRNDPNQPEALSGLSPYYHFGHLAAQRSALEASKLRSKAKDDVDAFLEESVVRRELSDNYCFYVPNYDSLDACYDWAKDSLNKHRSDKREHVYTLEELEKGETHDELWNASQKEMTHTGKMHGFMRMYWAKKILEWTESPEQAIEFGIYLNDKWEIDGRDANGYVGIMWSMGGIHDQGWSEREIFGKIRYMNEKGCRRKFKVDAYIENVNERLKKPA